MGYESEDDELDPQEIRERLKHPESVRGQARELYELAENHYTAFEELIDEADRVEDALYELEAADKLLEAAELDTQIRDGDYHAVNGYLTEGDKQ